MYITKFAILVARGFQFFNVIYSIPGLTGRRFVFILVFYFALVIIYVFPLSRLSSILTCFSSYQRPFSFTVRAIVSLFISVLLVSLSEQRVDAKIGHTTAMARSSESPQTKERSKDHTYVVKNVRVYEQTTKG